MKEMNHVKLPGAKFVLIDKCGDEIACGVTNECGELVFDCLPFGTYFIKEIEAPCGFEKSNRCIEVCIDNNSRHKCIEFMNERKKGSIKIIKLGC